MVCEGRSGSPQYESEFKFMTKDKLIKGDPLLSDLFLLNGEVIWNNKYKIPTNPVDGVYHGCAPCPDGPDHGGR